MSYLRDSARRNRNIPSFVNEVPKYSEDEHSKETKNCPYRTFLETGDVDRDSLFIDTAAIGRMTAVVDGLKNSDGFLGSLSGWMNNPLPGLP